MPKKETFAARLARIREAAGLSQRQLASRAGLSQQAVSLLERGLRDPTLGTLRALAAVLAVDVTGLVRDLAE
jgi:transcriptional regulator with XRE-family HTH domain